MKKKMAALCMVMALMMTLLAGCSSGDAGNEQTQAAVSEAETTGTAEETVAAEGDTGETESAAEETMADMTDKTIVCIMKDNVSPFHLSLAEGCEKAGEDYNVNVVVQSPASGAGGSNEEQTQLIDQAIASQADAVVLVPVDSEGIVPAVKRLNEAGIPVIDVGTPIGGEDARYESLVAVENYAVGYQMADALCQAMGGKGKIFIIEGTTGAQNSMDRTEGAKDAIAQYPDIEIAADQSANFNRATAMDVVQNLLQQTPDVNAIFCCNDEMALGAAEAVNAAGKTGEILISGVDGNADTLTAIQDGSIYTTCNTNPEAQGYYGVYEAVKYLSTGEADENYTIDIIVITKDNVEEYITE